MTAVKWLINELNKKQNGEFSDLSYDDMFSTAMQMEKEQMKQIMWDLTDIDMAKTNKGLVIDNMFEEYYNETYKSE